MAHMYFGRGPGETLEPSGVVVRTLPDGTLDSTLIEGDDENVVLVAKLLVKMINTLSMENFLPMARAAGEQAGFDIDAMLAEINDEQAGG